MKKYIAPSIQVVNVENEALLTTSNISTADYNGQTLLGNRRSAHYFEEEDDFDFEN